MENFLSPEMKMNIIKKGMDGEGKTRNKKKKKKAKKFMCTYTYYSLAT